MLIIKNETFNSDSNSLNALLINIQSVIDNKMGKFNNLIIVEHDPDNYYPMVYVMNIAGQKTINLGDYPCEWDRYVFQFAHEYCHVRTNFQSIKYNYQWLEEIFSHMASHYVLIKLSEEWKTKPPFENWMSYANSLKNYSDNIISKINDDKNNMNLISIRNSLIQNDNFNYNDEQRTFFEIKCLEILLLFQKDENYWKSLSYWNTWVINIADTEIEVFRKWWNILPKNLKYVVENIYSSIIK